MMQLFVDSCPPRVYIILDDYGFALFDETKSPNQNALARSQSGKELARWAFNHGASHVKHHYDLGKEPNP